VCHFVIEGKCASLVVKAKVYSSAKVQYINWGWESRAVLRRAMLQYIRRG